MKGYIRLAAVVFLFCMGIALGEEVDSIEIDNDVVEQGSDVSIRCVVADYQPGTIMYWWKRQGDDIVQMGVNNKINAIFFNTGRYFSEGEFTDEGAAFSLHIRGTEAEDSGDIGCTVTELGDDAKYVSLHVVVPVEELHLYSLTEDLEVDIEYQDGMEVPFNEGDEHHFQCTAAGSNPEPEITMTLGDEDLSEYFDIETTSEMMGGTAGLKQIYYTTTATTHTAVNVAASVNAYDFRCTVAVPHTDDVSIGITPSLKFAPTLECPKKVKKEPYTKDLEIKCLAKANPLATYGSVQWMRNDNSEDFITLTHEDGKHFNYKFTIEDGKTEDERTLKLTISRASYQVFRDYTFTVNNHLGEAKKTVKLEMDESNISDGAESIFASTLVSCLLIVVAHLLRY